MRTDYIAKGEAQHILAALFPDNRLACEISLATGLRINDVLALKTAQVAKGRFTIREEKTGKTRFVRLPADLQRRCLLAGGNVFVFPHRLNGRKHRTRQAVFKDLKRVARAFRCRENIAPHSLRKSFAVEEYQKHGDLKRVQKLLNHSDEAVTYIYAMSNIVSKRKNYEKS